MVILQRKLFNGVLFFDPRADCNPASAFNTAFVINTTGVMALDYGSTF